MNLTKCTNIDWTANKSFPSSRAFREQSWQTKRMTLKLSQRKREEKFGWSAGGVLAAVTKRSCPLAPCLSDDTEARGGLWPALATRCLHTTLSTGVKRVCPAHRISSAFNSCVHSSAASLLEVRRRVQAEARASLLTASHVDLASVRTPSHTETQRVLYGWSVNKSQRSVSVTAPDRRYTR